MAKTALIYDADGVVVGSVTCSSDDDLALQPHARKVEVSHDHPAVIDPRGWKVSEKDGNRVPKKDPDP